MPRTLLVTSEMFEEIISSASYKVIAREKHYRHNAEHQTFAFERDGTLWMGNHTQWEDGGPGWDDIECSEAEEYVEPVTKYRAKSAPDA